MKVVFDAAKLHDEVVKAIDRAECEAYGTLQNRFLGDRLMEVCVRSIPQINKHLVILARIRDVTAMSSMRDITLSEEEIDIIRKYTRSDLKC